MEQDKPAIFTEINHTDEIRKNNPNFDAEFEFHQKNTYINTKENKSKKTLNRRLIITNFPE